jgi:hypothetical protein
MNRRYVIFSVTEVPLINFDEVYQTSPETMRSSVDGTLTFVKYDLPTPPCVVSLTTKSQEYTHEEFLVILNGPEWTPQPNPSGSL